MMQRFREKLSRVATRKILFPEHQDPRVEQAIQNLRGIVEPVRLADVYSSEVVDALQEQHKSDRAAAEVLAENPLISANVLLRLGKVDGVIAGSIATTKDVVKCAIKYTGMKEGLLSSSFLMLHPRGSLIFADCAVNIAPSVDQLALIAQQSVQTASQLLDDAPRVAFLSFSTAGSADHPMVHHVRDAHAKYRTFPNAVPSAGEVQADCALIPEVLAMKTKAALSECHPSNVLIFPDLNCGNIAYKMVNRLGDYAAVGPIFQGLKFPSNDLSRGCSVQDIEDMAVITALQSASTS